MEVRPTDVALLVSYQPDSIVSRKLVAQTGGNVTAFAFAQGQELSEHSTPFEALVQVIEGEALIRVGGEEHRVAAGQLLPLPATVPHALRAEHAFKMLLTMVRPAA